MITYFLLCLLIHFPSLKADFLLNEAKKYGYIGELHNVETSDGYILGHHRIYSRSYARKSKEIVFFVHGLGGNSACYAAGGKSSQVHLLADRGFDVWLFNARGNFESSKHRTLTEHDPAYWNYSWHENGVIDVPQSIDYILRTTNRSNLNYVGHSQGGAVFGALLSVLPEYNAKIKSAFLMAPAIYVSHAFPLVRLFLNPNEIVPIVLEPAENLSKVTNILGIRFSDEPWHSLIRLGLSIIPPDLLTFGINIGIGGPSGNEDHQTHAFLGLFGTGAGSVKQMLHFGQMYTGKFQMFDYGPRNKEVYGSDKPPLYNLKNIRVPVNVVYGGNDAIITPTDVRLLIKALGKNVANEFLFEKWQHLDFLYPVNIVNELVPRMLDEAKKYGYVGELHNFETSDGFTMGLHRIYSRSYAKKSKEIIFFVPSLGCNSACYASGGKSNQIHLLADQGFDVWLFNSRGNLVSSKHRTLTEDDPAYWDYSFHEIGVIDVPQSIDYILRSTNRSNLNYVGHSQGGAVFGVLLSVLPEYNAKIKSAFLLSPSVYVSHSLPYIRMLINPNAIEALAQTHALLGLFGGDTGSLKQLLHFGQNMLSESFEMFDYGPRNKEVYGSDKPPLYNLSNIQVPINVVYGGNDLLVPDTDVKRLIKELGKNVVNEYFYENWQHIDVLYPVNIINKLLPKMLKFYRKNK